MEDTNTISSPSLATNKNAPPPKVLLSSELIAEALRASQDDGQTLDLSHKTLTEVTDLNARELSRASVDPLSDESNVLRVALGYNRLTSLPRAFITLARIRYLNLRSNLFSNFPTVLTAMPSLEVLDISRNRIKRLPPDPGALRNLRVFSISRNRFTKLPHYLTSFQSLTVFKVSHNPIMWPDGMKEEPDVDDPDAMKHWIAVLKRWLEESARLAEAPEESGDISSSSFGVVKESIDPAPPDVDPVSGDEDLSHLSNGDHVLLTPHARSYSIDSVSTTTSQPDGPPSPESSFRSPFPSPGPLDSSISVTDIDGISGPAGSLYSESILLDSPQVNPLHARNASYSVGGQPRTLGATLTANKSLPDLRLGFQQQEAPAPRRSKRPNLPDLPLPELSSSATGYSPSPSGHSPGFLPPMHRMNGTSYHASSPSNGHTTDSQMSSVDPERNAYFRRFSVQRPPPTDRSGPPPALLAVVDAARGIFFALSQMYEALRQFTVSVTHEGLSGVLMKVLHPARKFLSQLIDALDRFDEQAKQPVPSPIVCRSVVQSCRDSVSIFGKVVGVLKMQLKLVTATHDPRYTRWLLLILHGSMTEVSLSWQTIQENSEAIQSYLQTSRLKPHAPSRSLVSPVTPDVGQSSASPSSNGSASNAMGWQRTTRRQGGSFGTRELQMTRTTSSDALPNTPPPLRPSGGSNGGLPSFGGNGLSAPSSNGGFHTRDNSASSQISRFEAEMNNGFVTSQSSSSPPNRTQPSQPLAASAMDQNLFATMDDTIDVASGVWSTLLEIVAEHNLHALAATLENSQEVTRRLRADLDSFRIGSTAALRRAIWEDANAFLKMAVQVLSEIKGLFIDLPQALPLSAKKSIASLGQLMQEFAVLLQISSFAPSPTAPDDSRPPSGARTPSRVTPPSTGVPRTRDATLSHAHSQHSHSQQSGGYRIPPSPFLNAGPQMI